MRSLVASADETFELSNFNAHFLGADLERLQKKETSGVYLILTTVESVASVTSMHVQSLLVSSPNRAVWVRVDLFRVWHEPRAQHRYTNLIHIGKDTFILADARRSPYVPDHLALRPRKDLVVVKGKQGMSCSTTCSQHKVTAL